MLEGPDLHYPYGTLYYDIAGAMDGTTIHTYDTAKWKIISLNNVTDMELNINALPIYNDSIPYFVSLSAGLTIPLEATTYPGADSIRISISGALWIDTILHSITGPVTFSASKLSSIHDASYLTVNIFTHSTVTINGRNYTVVNGTETAYDIKTIP